VATNAIFIEAPSIEDYKSWDEEKPTRYYADPSKAKGMLLDQPALVIPLSIISLIEIDTQ
jgi:hypothetical protein